MADEQGNGGYNFLPNDLFSVLAMLAGASKKFKGPTGGSIGSQFTPELAALMGIYSETDPRLEAEQNYKSKVAEASPDWQNWVDYAALNPDSIEASIFGAINEGRPQHLIYGDINAHFDEQIQKGNQVLDRDGKYKRLADYADNVLKQKNAIGSLTTEYQNNLSKPQEDYFTKLGYRHHRERFTPEELAPEYYAKYYADRARRPQGRAEFADAKRWSALADKYTSSGTKKTHLSRQVGATEEQAKFDDEVEKLVRAKLQQRAETGITPLQQQLQRALIFNILGGATSDDSGDN
ncbi:MAG: hypothetical protein [Podoviridae sp. ctDWo9]|nr:MAG: hypothetical protein [Podoviridae sp. ctDWo9]